VIAAVEEVVEKVEEAVGEAEELKVESLAEIEEPIVNDDVYENLDGINFE
jgi:hypothetical protein